MVAVVITAAAGAHAGAQVLSTLFPEGVPGYGTQPGVTVLSRRHPELDPLGLRAGAFRVLPRLEESFGYDDNVLGGSPKHGSWTLSTRPSVLVGSDWSRHAFAAYVSLNNTVYPNLPAQNRTDGTVFAGGTIEIGRDRLTLSASHISTHQDRTQLDALPTDSPVAVSIQDARAAYELRSGAWTWTPNVQASHWHYGGTTIQGVPVSQSYRDRNVLQGGLTVRYEFAPQRNLVLVTRGIGQRYTQPTPGQPSSDSSGVQVLVGLDYDDEAVWRYRLLVGGETRWFANPAYRSHSGIIAEAEAIWTPTGMTTVRGSLSRGFQDAAQEGVSGYTYTTARLRIDHELTRQVILSATGGLQFASYFQGGRQWGYGLGAGVTWVMNRSVRFSATYDLGGVQGNPTGIGLVGSDYSRNIALLTVRLGL